MKKDAGQKRSNNRRPSNSMRSGGRSGGGVGINVISMLLPFLLKKPKLLIIVAIVGVVAYLFLGKGCSSSSLPLDQISQLFSTGNSFNKEAYESVEIYEPLADNVKNPLPEKVSLLKYAPKRLNQGRQGSCVAWASAYAARTILESQRTGKSPNSVRFSPSFMYNQISTDKNSCQGSYIKLAMDNMMGVGAVPFNDFKYDDRSCSKTPSRQLKTQAQAFKIKGFQRLTEEDARFASKEMLAIKQNLAQGSPVIIGMMVGGTFMSKMSGREVWIPSESDYNQRGFGGHAMCIIGYDDYKEGGAFQIMNSWGKDWGIDGVGWIRYTDFKHFNIESYGLYPMGNIEDKNETVFKGGFSLQLNSGQKSMNLEQVGDFYFETTQKINISDKFKVEYTNNVECYTYIFGQETDGSSYVLFPYTPKHSPYCGITGTRLFPRDYSMQADDKGEKDKIAVIITKKPMDYNEMNALISNASGISYEEKVKNALVNTREKNVQFKGKSTISFIASTNDNKRIAFVIGIKKNNQ